MVGKNLRVESFRIRAVELRAIAELMQISNNRERLLRIAEDYDRMADQIEKLSPGSSEA